MHGRFEFLKIYFWLQDFLLGFHATEPIVASQITVRKLCGTFSETNPGNFEQYILRLLDKK